MRKHHQSLHCNFVCSSICFSLSFPLFPLSNFLFRFHFSPSISLLFLSISPSFHPLYFSISLYFALYISFFLTLFSSKYFFHLNNNNRFYRVTPRPAFQRGEVRSLPFVSSASCPLFCLFHARTLTPVRFLFSPSLTLPFIIFHYLSFSCHTFCSSLLYSRYTSLS